MLSAPVAQAIESLHPETSQYLGRMQALSQAAADPALLELCRSYMEAALRCENWQPSAGSLTPREQAFIAFVEQFITAVDGMQAEQVTSLLDYASADEVYAFIHAIYVMDMSLRLEMVGREVLA